MGAQRVALRGYCLLGDSMPGKLSKAKRKWYKARDKFLLNILSNNVNITLKVAEKIATSKAGPFPK